VHNSHKPDPGGLMTRVSAVPNHGENIRFAGYVH